MAKDDTEEAVDMREILRAWPYNPEQTVRIVDCGRGRHVLQVRLPMGIEQYEMDGRPDGARPHNRTSALDFFLDRLTRLQASGREESFSLSEAECAELFEEGTLFYFRYLHLFQIGDWDRTIRDTGRNLQLFDFVHRHAARAEDREHLEKWRPYIVRIHGVARAMMELEKHNFGAALQIVNGVIARIEGLPDSDDETFRVERERSITALREIAMQIENTRPVTELERLERALRSAVEAQKFEQAAELRDRIRALRGARGGG